eukprot:8351338-Pyramimonas_sp.AAC.1
MGPLRVATGPRRTVRGPQTVTAGPRRACTWDYNGRDSWVPGCRERGCKRISSESATPEPREIDSCIYCKEIPSESATPE